MFRLDRFPIFYRLNGQPFNFRLPPKQNSLPPFIVYRQFNRPFRRTLGASKTISEPMVHLEQTVHLSCTTLTPSPNTPNEVPHDPRHLGVPAVASKTISEPMVR